MEILNIIIDIAAGVFIITTVATALAVVVEGHRIERNSNRQPSQTKHDNTKPKSNETI